MITDPFGCPQWSQLKSLKMNGIVYIYTRCPWPFPFPALVLRCLMMKLMLCLYCNICILCTCICCRGRIYAKGGVLFITSRILVVEFLSGRLLPESVAGILVWKAHKFTSCFIYFILVLTFVFWFWTFATFQQFIRIKYLGFVTNCFSFAVTHFHS